MPLNPKYRFKAANNVKENFSRISFLFAHAIINAIGESISMTHQQIK